MCIVRNHVARDIQVSAIKRMCQNGEAEIFAPLPPTYTAFSLSSLIFSFFFLHFLLPKFASPYLTARTVSRQTSLTDFTSVDLQDLAL